MRDKIELEACPFCGFAARLESNRDWHRIIVDHDEQCVFLDSECVMVPATDEQLQIAVADWNRRAALTQKPAQAVPAVRALQDSDSVPDDFRNQASGYRAGWNDCLATAAPAAQESVAWMNPETGDVWSEKKKQTTRESCGTPGAKMADAYSAPLYATPPAAEQPEKLIDRPAKVGAVRFHVGVSWRTVVEAAQRHYEHEVTPPFSTGQVAGLAEALQQAEKQDSCSNCFEGKSDMDHVCRKCGGTGRQPEAEKVPHALLEWAVDRWHAEVSNRPLVNVHRRTLDNTWRQVIRRLGGDPVDLCGPSHDTLLAGGEA